MEGNDSLMHHEAGRQTDRFYSVLCTLQMKQFPLLKCAPEAYPDPVNNAIF